MLSRLVQAVTMSVRRRARRVNQSIKDLLRPARTAAALVGAGSLDAVRPRSVLMAENALLRQQILVLRRVAPPLRRGAEEVGPDGGASQENGRRNE